MKRIRYNSPIILTFAMVSLVVLLLGPSIVQKYFCVYNCSIKDPMAYFRFFSHILGHADFSHYINNMLILLLIGPPLEEKYGSFTLLELMLITAFVTGLVHFIVFPTTALCGASGLVFMMIILTSFTSTKNGIPLTFVLIVLLYLGSELYSAIYLKDNISQGTHIIGGLLGMIYGFKLRKKST